MKRKAAYLCRYLVRPIGHPLAIFAIELGKPVEIVDQTDIVALHGDAGGDQHAPRSGLGVELQALPEGHPLLLDGRGLCIVDDLGH